MSYIYLRTPPASGAWNMALDEFLLGLIDSGDASFRLVLRTFEWEPACVSFGRLQDPAAEVDLRALLADGVDVVARPTGGRAVWHHDEVTYSVIADREHPLVRGPLARSLRSVSEPLVAALRRLGLAAEAGKATLRLPRGRGLASPCFTSHGVSEVMVGGRKVVGSAQTRTRNAFLEHGSLLISNQQTRLVDYMPGSMPDEWRERVRERLRRGVAGIGELRPGTRREELHESLLAAFQDVLDRPLVPVSPSEFEGPGLWALEERKRRLKEACSGPARPGRVSPDG